MRNLWKLGDFNGKGSSIDDIDYDGLPDEIGGHPITVKGLILDVTLVLNSAAGGAGVTGRKAFDCIKDIRVHSDGEDVIRGLTGGHCMVLEHVMTGKEPELPTDLAAAGGAATMQLQIIVPFTDLGITKRKGRHKDYGQPGEVLKKTGALSFETAADGDFGNANDTITSISGNVHAWYDLLSEGEVPQELVIDIRSYEKQDFDIPRGRYRYAVLVPANGAAAGAGTEFAAGEITQLDAKVNGQSVLNRTDARTLVRGFNAAAEVDDDDRLFAPDDTALGQSHFFPIFYPEPDEAAAAVPFGGVRLEFQGTKANGFRVLTVDVVDMTDKKRAGKLVHMGYPASAVYKLSDKFKVPKTPRPVLGGHLNMSPRKRALLPQIWHGLKRIARGRENC